VRRADWSLHASRPGQAQCSQRIDIDLRVNPGSVVVLVPQQLSDLRQGRARSEKLGSETVSEDMGAAVCATFDSNAIEGGLGDHGDRTSGSKPDVRRECADEQPSARRLWAAAAQICNDGRANVWRYRHPCTLSALGANEYLAGAPVDIIERERRDLVGPQAELGQQLCGVLGYVAHEQIDAVSAQIWEPRATYR